MAVVNDPSAAANISRVGEVGTGATGGLHTVRKPLPSSIGHYSVSHRCAIVAAQVANSRLFELRNAHATNLLVLLALTIKWLHTAAHTAAIEDSLDAYKVTGFTAVDTVNTVTPVGSIRRSTMTAFPGNALVRGVTVAGAANGMTGGTLTKDSTPFLQLPQWMLLAQPTAGLVLPAVADLPPDLGGHPFVFSQNEGFIIENRVLLGAAAGSSVYIDAAWAEVAAF